METVAFLTFFLKKKPQGDFGGITKQVEYTLGHELCGVVAEVGEGAKEDFKVGDRINVDPHRYSSSHTYSMRKTPNILIANLPGAASAPATGARGPWSTSASREG